MCSAPHTKCPQLRRVCLAARAIACKHTRRSQTRNFSTTTIDVPVTLFQVAASTRQQGLVGCIGGTLGGSCNSLGSLFVVRVHASRAHVSSLWYCHVVLAGVCVRTMARPNSARGCFLWLSLTAWAMCWRAWSASSERPVDSKHCGGPVHVVEVVSSMQKGSCHGLGCKQHRSAHYLAKQLVVGHVVWCHGDKLLVAERGLGELAATLVQLCEFQPLGRGAHIV